MSQSFQQVFQDYKAYLSGIMAEAGTDAIKKFSEELSQDIEKTYDEFFTNLYAILADKPTTTPGVLQGNIGGEGAWRPLSERWSDRKAKQGLGGVFYHGLTDAIYKAKVQLRSQQKRGQKGRMPKKGESFMTFLKGKSDNSAKEVKKIFGPVDIKYSIEAKGNKTPVNIQQRGNAIASLSSIMARDSRGRFLPRAGNVRLVAEIQAFPVIAKAKDFSEWYVVNEIIKKDRGNRAQWRKVNSRTTPRGIRPIRAIITPLISFYMTSLFASKTRSKFL